MKQGSILLQNRASFSLQDESASQGTDVGQRSEQSYGSEKKESCWILLTPSLLFGHFCVKKGVKILRQKET